MDAFIASAKDLMATADEAGRKKILDTLRDVSYSLENTQESAQRILFLHMQLAAVRIGCDLKLFNILTESATPLTTAELVKVTGAAPELLARILRYLASIGCIKEVSQDLWTKTNVSETFSIPGFQGGVHHYFDSLGPAVQALPDFLKETNYQDIVEDFKTPLQKAWNTPYPAYIWVQTKPENFAYFNQYMGIQRMDMPTWLDTYPYKEKLQGLDPEQPAFVDLGGGIGHQSIELREKLPELKNKIILQDIPQTLEHAIKHPGVEIVVQDFFQPQGTKGARIYYARNIMHNYADEKAVTILKNTVAAMGPDSVILIDDMVVPNVGAHWQTTQLDITMMAALGSIERTKDMWYTLAEKAGLKINHIYTYTASLQDSIIEFVPI